MYKALHSDLTIEKSSIHGLGLFAIKASRGIKRSEELTVSYTLYKID